MEFQSELTECIQFIDSCDKKQLSVIKMAMKQRNRDLAKKQLNEFSLGDEVKYKTSSGQKKGIVVQRNRRTLGIMPRSGDDESENIPVEDVSLVSTTSKEETSDGSNAKDNA